MPIGCRQECTFARIAPGNTTRSSRSLPAAPNRSAIGTVIPAEASTACT
jgi:hypothetical protein